jgi:alpha-L-rhamnosidase
VITRLAVEHRDALGIGTATPRLSWIGEATEVEVDGIRYPVEGSVLVPWPAPPLESRQRATVRVGDAELAVEAGLLSPEDWTARFASPDVPLEATALLRRAFTVDHLGRARLYVTALGAYEVELNGTRVGDHVLAPGWTSYGRRLRYQTFDVGGLLVEGENVITATVADGWFRGRLGFGGGRAAIYGERLAILAQLEVDGAPVVVSDADWTWTAGPTTRASIYDGEHHDARLRPGRWQPVELVARDLSLLVAPLGPPVRVTQEVQPVAVTTSPSGATLVDFGQNLVGRLRLTTSGAAGDEVVLRHAEILEGGELCTEPLREAEATDRYALAGDGAEMWAPRFTFHGFRHAEVSGPWDSVTAEVCHSDLRRTGWFECSDERVDQLHRNVVWGMRGNFLDVPTDCPQRAERLGWTGDICVFAPTATFLYDVAGFLSSWLVDLAAEQDEMGVPWVVPDVVRHDWRIGTAVWGDAAVEVPWVLYERYGDLEVLARQFDSMQRWIEHILRFTDAPGHWRSPFQFGDWVDPAAPPDNPAAARTDPHLLANAWFCHSLGRVGDVAELLGEPPGRWRDLEATARTAFTERYVHTDGTMASDAQTAYALGLRFDLVEDRGTAGERLVALVEEEGHRIGTGFVGTPIISDALCDVGAVDTAYRLLLQTECPSWLYPVTMGATTVWERWDSLRPDGTRNPGDMNSFNHYALGAVADWLHRRVAGLAPAEPGYRKLHIAPLPGPDLDHASAQLDTPYGRAEAGWRRAGAEITVHATVPGGATAAVHLPGGVGPLEVGPGTHRWTV